MVTKEDLKFRRWLDNVSPDAVTEEQIMGAIDWETVLKILIDIFQVILALGCLAAARATSDVKKIMKAGLTPDTAGLLVSYLNILKGKIKK